MLSDFAVPAERTHSMSSFAVNVERMFSIKNIIECIFSQHRQRRSTVSDAVDVERSCSRCQYCENTSYVHVQKTHPLSRANYVPVES